MAGLLALTACSPSDSPAATTSSPPTATATTVPASSTTIAPPEVPTLDPAGSFVVLAFTNHLPEFGRTSDGAADRPWARLHTTRDYISMTRLIAETDAKVVLGYSPVLLEQIADVAEGRWDQAALITAKPPNELTDEDRAYIDAVFFNVSAAQLDGYPRYRDIADRRDRGLRLSTTDYRDLQVLFNLAWTSPLLLAEEPLAALASRGRNFTEADKQVVLDAHQAAAAEFLSSLQSLSANGEVEIATTPLTNPILPLLVRSRMDQDATDQILEGASRAAAVLGRAPRGLAPAAGLIDQANATATHAAGFEWLLLVSPEDPAVFQLTSEEGTLLALAADAEPGNRMADTYFDVDPTTAAADVLESLSAALGDGPETGDAVVTVVADGTEPWGRYADGGIAFLRALFRGLADADDFATVLPSELADSGALDPGPFPELPSSYLPSTTQVDAWNLLADTRRELLRQRAAGIAEETDLATAYSQVLAAQGSDWYRWYNPLVASSEDAYFDDLFRSRLTEVWRLFGETPLDGLLAPLHVADPAPGERLNDATPAKITIDNTVDDAEWSRAGRYSTRAGDLVERVYYTFDNSQLFIRVDFTTEVLGDSAPGFDLYLREPGGSGPALTPRRNAIGFDATMLVKWRGTNPIQILRIRPYLTQPTTLGETQVAGFDGDAIEFALDLEDITPAIAPGDRIDFRVVEVTGGPEGTLLPATSRGFFEFPNLTEGILLARLRDRLDDGHGPGAYSHTPSREIPAGTFDLAGLAVRLLGGPSDADPDSEGEVQFEITFREPLTNPWSAPAGFSHPSVDVYVEAYPGSASGARRLLPGRVAAVEAGAGWNAAVTVDGWDAAHYAADNQGRVTEGDLPLEYKLLADRRTILVTVPRAAFPPGDESVWRYGVAVTGNRAVPSRGHHGPLPLADEPGIYHLGGSTGAVNDTRIIDLLHPDRGAQEAALSNPVAVYRGDPEDVAIDQLARLPMLGG